jgi:hypothetical protein
MAAIGGFALALFLLATLVAPVGLGLPIATSVMALLLLAGAWSMARQAGTPLLLPVGIFSLTAGAFFALLWSSW